MINWKQERILYHGSFCAVPSPDLQKCNPFKDFGQGFCLTTSKEQAIRFIPTALKKAKHLHQVLGDSAYGFVTIYRFSLSNELKCKEYESADADWLHCIAAHRKSSVFEELKEELHSFDVIAGKIANDQTNATLTAYLAGLYGDIGSPIADESCIRQLLPERLENQICLRTPAALSKLIYEGEELLWIP